MNKIWIVLTIVFMIAFLILLIFTILLVKKWRAPYIGSVHVVRDNTDGEAYMFLVIEKGRDHHIQNNKIVRIKVVEDIPQRGKDRE